MLRPPALVPGLLLGLLLGLAGCGGSEAGGGKEAGRPSKAAVACRKEWKALEDKVGGRDSRTNPSALAERWNTISATIDYYVSSASGTDCGKTLETQKSAMTALAAFNARLARYDMELKLSQVRSDAQAYAAGPRPPAPKASPAPKGKKKKKPKRQPRPPRPAAIAAALKTLTAQAPQATRQQGPGWEQAKVVELRNAAAVRKAIKDLSFLSSESRAYRASSAALAQIRTALAAKTG